MTPDKKRLPVAPVLKVEVPEAPDVTLQPSQVAGSGEGFYKVPSSPATDLIHKVLGSGGDLANLPTKGKSVSHGTQLSIFELAEKRQIISESNAASITIELADVDKLTGTNKAAKKMFVFALVKINEQAYSGGAFRRNFIGFPLQELVDIGFYSRIQSARYGFRSAADILTSMKIKGSLKKGRNKAPTVEALSVLFTDTVIEKNYCTIYLNERIDWGLLASFYTILPRYAFRLPNRSFDLLYYIFYLARQNTKAIKKKGSFNISFRALQDRLNLPSEKGNTDPQRTIKEPIEKAITDIEEANRNSEFTMTPMYDDTLPIADYLNSGYLKIELKGGYAADFIALAEEQTKQVAVAAKRKKTIEDNARIKALADKMKEEEAPPADE